MRHLICTILFFISYLFTFAQSGSVEGHIQDERGEAVIFANCALFHALDSSLIKAEMSDAEGDFSFHGIAPGDYFLDISYVGMQKCRQYIRQVNEGLKLEDIVLKAQAMELEGVEVTAQRAMVEVKADRTVFNVEGTINSVGNNGLELLRKAPGLVVDNNNNISVLGRSGVLVYVDGQRLPLTGEQLSNYLESLTAEQIDRIDIITNPGSKYEAQGNAGIIDIRLKKAEDQGFNGSLNSSLIQGRYLKQNYSFTGNLKNKWFNAFGTLALNDREGFNTIEFDNYQNGVLIQEENRMRLFNQFLNGRIGVDFNISDHHKIGVLLNSAGGSRTNNTENTGIISSQQTLATIDSILIADMNSETDRNNQSYNVHYQFEKDKSSISMDLDYGQFKSSSKNYQPNFYYDGKGDNLLSQRITQYDTESDIDISTAKLDYEREMGKGKIGLGGKFSHVNSDNSFLFYNIIDQMYIRDDQRSNDFVYDEKVYASYIDYHQKLSDKWSLSSGLRAEWTHILGALIAFDPSLNQDPVEQEYVNFFPNLGMSYTPKAGQSFALNYGRRINRPDYSVLNPFESQLSELSFEKGNPELQAERVNNIEMSYTLGYRYNFKLAYSHTKDKITRLIAPDDRDPRAGFISWDNISDQEVVNFNLSAPVPIQEWWNAYFNINASYMRNQAQYEDGSSIDLDAFNYVFFNQHTFKLPRGLTGEISGYYSGPGIWGGVFEYEDNWSLDLGLQKSFFNDRLSIKLTANDIFYKSGWRGTSNFAGLYAEGSGRWDSRRVGINLSYKFGNDKVKVTKRKSGIEEESRRVGGAA